MIKKGDIIIIRMGRKLARAVVLNPRAVTQL
jgi:hypothetical protein